MSKHEDQFFNMFRDSLKDFSPEVPEAVYSGIRKRMRRQGFFTFSLGTLNFWYLALAAGVVATVAVSNFDADTNSMALKNIDRVDEVIEKPNNQLLASLTEDDLTEESVNSNQILIAENLSGQKKTFNNNQKNQGQQAAGNDDNPGGNDLGNDDGGAHKGDEVDKTDEIADNPIEMIQVIETKEITSNFYVSQEIGLMKYNLKHEIEQNDIIKIQVPIPAKK